MTALPLLILTDVTPSLTTLFLQLKFIIDYANYAVLQAHLSKQNRNCLRSFTRPHIKIHSLLTTLILESSCEIFSSLTTPIFKTT